MSRLGLSSIWAALLLAWLESAALGETIGYWRFEGDASGFVADASGHGLTLTLAAGAAAPAQTELPDTGDGSRFHDPLPQTGAANAKAARFDGGDQATVADSPAFTGSAFTIEAYIHLVSLGTTTQVIAGHFDSSTNKRSWALVVTGGKLSLYLSANGTTIENVASSVALQAGRDYYVAATANLADTSSAGITLYVQNLTDGGTISAESRAHTTTAVLDTSAPLAIGTTANATSPFNGFIDEVRLSNERITANQLLARDPSDPPILPPLLPAADGFRGIWYWNEATGDQYVYKYSGGMATYPQQLMPIAIYSAVAGKTFFVYGGTDPANSTIYHMVSYYDHATRQVARPRILLDKATTDAHDNPVLSIDDAGYLWIFSNTHGETRRSWLHKSVAPYAIDRFVEIPLPAEAFPSNRFSYSEPWWVPGQGFLFLHIRYTAGSERDLYWTTSADGVTWTPRQVLSQMLVGQYQISARHGSRVATAFDVHPTGLGLNYRTNLYYLETTDMAATWRTADGTAVAPLPLTDPANPARVLNYLDANPSNPTRVYLKDLAFDAAGHPVILFLESPTHHPGPATPARKLRTARWTGAGWVVRDVLNTDHNYDHGFLAIEPDGAWRVLGTFLDGPQAFGTGGEVGFWLSRDEGASWQLDQQLTAASPFNHNYPRRPVNARDDFFALWADGNAFAPSASSLCFTDRHGDAVLRLPTAMSGDFAFPEIVSITEPTADPDGDGADNANEFGAGTDPRDPLDFLRVTPGTLAAGTGMQITFATVSGKRYRVLYTGDLVSGSWLPLAENLAGTGAPVTVEDPDAPAHPRRFYRVQVAP